MKQFLSVLLFCLLSASASYSQDESKEYLNEYKNIIKRFEPQSPQTSMMQRFGNYPVDYSTGVPSISIPLYTIKIDDFELPVSISYHNSGIRVQDIATPVGLGWVLNAGGCISHTVMGSDDCESSDEGIYGVQGIEQRILDSHSTDISTWELIAKGNGADLLSDRYSYNFCGNSGVFRYDIKNRLYHTFPYSTIKIEAKKTLRHNSTYVDSYNYTPYVITDDKGIKYYFDYTEGSRGDYTYGGHGHVDAYYLTKIILPNGKDSIVFRYTEACKYNVQSFPGHIETGIYYEPRETNNGNGESVMRLGYVANLPTDHSAVHTAERSVTALTDIEWNGNIIHFDYSTDRQEALATTTTGEMPRLTKMAVTNFLGNIIRTAELDNSKYFGNSPLNYRMMLNSITIKGEDDCNPETYSFEYNEACQLPQYCRQTLYHYSSSQLDWNCHEDYWGYYNGSSGLSWIPIKYSISNIGTDRSPNEESMKVGCLTSVTYPTGGKTVYDMEANRLNDGTIWGGLRVKDIRSYDSDGETLLSYKSYKYENAIPSVPESDFEKLYSYNATYRFYMKYDDVTYDGWEGAVRNVSVSNPAIPLSADYGSPVYYYSVTEYTGNDKDSLGWTVYNYTDGRTNDMSMYGYEDDDDFAYNSIQNYSQWANFDFGNVSTLLESKSTYDAKGKLLSATFNNYEDELMDTILIGARFQSKVNWINYSEDWPEFLTTLTYVFNQEFLEFIRDNYSYSNVWGVPSYKKLASTKSIHDGITEDISYSYDDKRRTLSPVRQTTALGKDVISTSYTYPCLSADSVSQSMALRNLHIPTKTVTARNGAVVTTDSIAYAYTNGAYLPKYQYYAVGNAPLEKRLEYTYDKNNKVTSICRDGIECVYFVWGYKGMYPIAKISGLPASFAPSSALNGMLYGIQSQTNEAIIEGMLENMKAHFGTSCLMTKYVYNPLVGMTAQTAPNGLKTTYSYDSAGRLVEIKDNDGNTVSKYDYNYSK